MTQWGWYYSYSHFTDECFTYITQLQLSQQLYEVGGCLSLIKKVKLADVK